MTKKAGVCAYWDQFVKRLTKEHVIPRCVGGVLKIRVCAACNNKRGSKGDDPAFEAWCRKYPDVFKRAIQVSVDPTQTLIWLRLYGKDKCTGKAVEIDQKAKVEKEKSRERAAKDEDQEKDSRQKTDKSRAKTKSRARRRRGSVWTRQLRRVPGCKV